MLAPAPHHTVFFAGPRTPTQRVQPHAAAEMLVAFVLVMLAVLADGAGLAGIPPDLLSQYSRMDHGYFTCLDGNGTVPLDYVNDEYCDCPTDGSDEPGTSACAGVSNSTFWCPNVGYVAAAIPTSRVGDGICDCCDGSDEHTASITCPNRCAELTSVANREIDARREIVKRAIHHAERLALLGRSLREVDEVAMSTLRAKLEAIAPQYNHLKAKYEQYLQAERDRIGSEDTMETAQADLDHAESGTNEQAPRETEWASSRACSMDDGCGVAASSHDWLGPAWKAVDGDDNPDYDGALSCTHTNEAANDRHAWWQIDLRKKVQVRRVILQNRLDPHSDRLVSAEVWIGGGSCVGYSVHGQSGSSCHSDDRIRCGMPVAVASSGSVHEFECDHGSEQGLPGQYVTVLLPGGPSGGRWLSFCEIEIYGVPNEIQPAPRALDLDAVDALCEPPALGGARPGDELRFEWSARGASTGIVRQIYFSSERTRMVKARLVPPPVGLLAQSSDSGLEAVMVEGPGPGLSVDPEDETLVTIDSEKATHWVTILPRKCPAMQPWMLPEGLHPLKLWAKAEGAKKTWSFEDGAECGGGSCGDTCTVTCDTDAGFAPDSEASSAEEQLAVYTCGSDGEWVPPVGSLICIKQPVTMPKIVSVKPADGMLTIEFEGTQLRLPPAATLLVTALPVTGQARQAIATGTKLVAIKELANEVDHSLLLTLWRPDEVPMESTWPESVVPTAIEREWHEIEEQHSDIVKALDELDLKLMSGQSDAMRAKQSECVSSSLGGYTYKLCFFDKVEQKEGHRWNNLGRFDPNGDEATNAKEATYRNGDRCYGGANRQTLVRLECGEKDAIVKVDEPETCSYQLRATTPAVCTTSDLPVRIGKTLTTQRNEF